MNDNETSMTLLSLFRMGGVFMWPLLAFSVATVSITLERIIFIIRCNLRLDDIKEQLIKFIGDKDFEGARNFLLGKKQKRLGARVLFALFEFPELRGQRLELEANAEAEAADCVASLENGFDYLTALGSLAPVTGFLGTVSGMIGAFKSIADATEVNAQIVANGIYEALITTVFGLIIAIIAMTAGSVLSHIVDSFSNDVETSCLKLIKMLK
ncbi:MAG: MotA/TolQ/ExbB proton channel family protein [Spirochaetaceae bacterium]|jgi:biopolymer transport protein ExbB|nr:MotA/TolQ/ExbB proton channel family protein [Spirochaetaceae bacterium]